ncbi:MAG: NADPH:quinone oxidoreductase family protein [Actinomycetota bacterium]|nr:NADPH:quinone oxidoreductase family protein [Actinomycetota bacterium]
MRGWQVVREGAPHEALKLAEDLPLPEPGPGQLRVRVSHAGVGLPDVLMCRGGGAYALTPPLPFTPGQEVVGEVIAVGDGAETALGERVLGVTAFFMGVGGFAEECLLLDDFALPAPPSLAGPEAASFAIPAHTAWVGLVQRARIEEGEWLLVLGGAGGTGSAAISLGRALGARVIATASGAERAEHCRALGADIVIDRRTGSIEDEVREATGGAGADVVYDTVGGDAASAASRCIAHEGRLLVVGYASGRWFEPRAAHLVQRSYSVMGVMPSGYDRAFRLDAQRRMLDLHARGELRVPVDRVIPFERLPDGLERVASGEALGKVVVAMRGALESAPST